RSATRSITIRITAQRCRCRAGSSNNVNHPSCRHRRNDRMGSVTVKIVERFWELMRTNDFRSVGSVLGAEFVLEWPQSKERIRGRDNYAAMNEEYPRYGRCESTINRIVGNDDDAVSDVLVTDGVQNARVISFFSVRGGVIVKMVEFWPEDFPAPENRNHLVENMDSYEYISN